MENIIGKITYYGSAVVGGVHEAGKFDLVENPEYTFEGFLRIGTAAFVSCVVAAIGKEIINPCIAWVKKTVTLENISKFFKKK